MKSDRDLRTGECAYCGAVGLITDDHVPPRNLFPPPRPNNLLVVPSCLGCNQGASLDDEYFRLTLTFRDDRYEHPAVQKLLPSVLRSLQKPKKLRFSQAFLRSIAEVDVNTKAGIYLGQRSAYNVDLTRLDRVAARIAKGLFYHERGSRLPNGYEMIAYNESGMAHVSKEISMNIQRRILVPLSSSPERVIGPDIFSYRFRLVESDPNLSAWLLTFFKAVAFICLSVTKEIAAMRPPNKTLDGIGGLR
jgi:hypothetical protein